MRVVSMLSVLAGVALLQACCHTPCCPTQGELADDGRAVRFRGFRITAADASVQGLRVTYTFLGAPAQTLDYRFQPRPDGVLEASGTPPRPDVTGVGFRCCGGSAQQACGPYNPNDPRYAVVTGHVGVNCSQMSLNCTNRLGTVGTNTQGNCPD